MPRETKRIEQLLANAQSSRALVREEIVKNGASLQHVYDELGTHEKQFTERLKDLNEFNKKEAAGKAAADKAAAPSAPAAKAKK